ncbi:MAG: DUF554 family protein [Thermovirgaceae bacterium]
MLFSAVPFFIYQGSLTLLALQLGASLTRTVLNEIAAVGGLMIISIWLNVLELQKTRSSTCFRVLFSLRPSKCFFCDVLCPKGTDTCP